MVVESSSLCLPLWDSKNISTNLTPTYCYCCSFRTSGIYRGSFQRRRFTNEDITVTLPDGTDACDIGTITIWCQPFRAIFTRLAIPRSTFVRLVQNFKFGTVHLDYVIATCHPFEPQFPIANIINTYFQVAPLYYQNSHRPSNMKCFDSHGIHVIIIFMCCTLAAQQWK